MDRMQTDMHLEFRVGILLLLNDNYFVTVK